MIVTAQPSGDVLKEEKWNLPLQEFHGIRIFNGTTGLLIQAIDRWIAGRHSIHIVPLNPHVFMIGTEDRRFRDLLREADVVLCDGIGIKLASRFSGTRIEERIVGTNFMQTLVEHASINGYRVFLLGGLSGAARDCAENLRKQWRGLNIAGWYEPPFVEDIQTLNDDDIVRRINDSKVDILFVALGAPKQEKWIERNRGRLNVTVMMSSGASFDFISGKVVRAPRWVQRIGMEWFFRLFVQPKRLWRRYLFGIPEFIWFLLSQERKNGEYAVRKTASP